MQNKKNYKTKKLSVIKIIAYLFCFLIILFLALPLIFKDKKQNEALPFKKETLFDSYYNSFKNFYFSKNKKEQNQFAKIKNDLETKKSFSKIKNSLAEVYQEEEENSGTRNNYYLEEENYIRPFFPPEEEQNYNNQNNNNQNDFNGENQNETFAMQEPYEDFLMEGLYETSQLDPYEAKQIAKQTIFDIFAPRTVAFLPSSTQFAQPLTKNIVLFNQNNISNETKNILFNNQNKTNSVAASAGNYINGVFNPFSQNSNFTKDKIDIRGLPFEEQASLVASKLNTVNKNNQNYHHGGANKPGQNPEPPKPPRPPLPPQDTFDPTKWDPKVDVLCSLAPISAVDENAQQPKSAAKDAKKQSQKIEHCDRDLQDKLPKVNNNMQKNYNYLLVSGRYKGKIMIPAFNSLSDTILTFGIQSESQDFLNYPKQLQGKQFAKNTKQTDFKFVADLNPQIFEQIMKEENTILLSVDEQDQQRYPDKTILIQSGEIETFPGVFRIIDEINNFPQKQAELKKAALEQQKQDKEQKAQDLQNKINSAI